MMIDLRSDTVTRPTDAMRRAMATAEVGDDVYGEDPTVNRLQDEVAERFGREAALFVPSGVMANQVALRTWARPGTEVMCEADAHLVDYEAGAGAIVAGVLFRTVTGDRRGQLTADLVRRELRPMGLPYTEGALVTVEQTTNRHGGTVYPLGELHAIRDVAHEAGRRLFMDGARVFNAVVASGTPPADYGAAADALTFCVSKALGAPVGSLLVGDADAIAEARGWRHRLGGALRQAGVLAAAGRHALAHHVDRLADDHTNARLIAEVVADAAADAVDPAGVETNMVYVRTGALAAAEVVARLADDGILVGAMGPDLLRLVTHLDVDEPACRKAAEVLARVLTA